MKFVGAELLTAGIAVGTIGVGAVVVGPSLINASTPAAPDIDRRPVDPALEATCDAVRALMGSAVEVLGTWTSSDNGFTEIALWNRDDVEPGVINRDEILLLTHSPTMGTLAAYTCAADEDAPDACASPVRRSAFSDSFPWKWRTTGGTQRAVIAIDLKEFRLRRVREGTEPPTWSVGLVWGGDVSDTDGDVCAFSLETRR